MAAKPRPIDDILAQALASGASRAAAARAAGCSVRTVHRRLEDPEFARRVGAMRTAALDDSYGRLCRATGAAIRRLEDLLKSEDSPAVQLGAARAILEAVLRFRQDVAFEERLRLLEVQAAAVSAQAVSR